MILRPCATSEEDNEDMWKRSVFYTESNFMNEYYKYDSAMSHVAECAKIFILKNWQVVENWSKLNIVIKDNKGKTEYYKYKKDKYSSKTDSSVAKFWKSMAKIDKKRHNPIKSFTDPVLDPSDGDFSVTINGRDHLWISDENVIYIAHFIEKAMGPIPEQPLLLRQVEWIPASKLPEVDGKYLVIGGSEQGVLHFSAALGWGWDGNWDLQGVKYWMTFPKPPKTD